MGGTHWRVEPLQIAIERLRLLKGVIDLRIGRAQRQPVEEADGIFFAFAQGFSSQASQPAARFQLTRGFQLVVAKNQVVQRCTGSIIVAPGPVLHGDIASAGARDSKNVVLV